MEKNLIDPRLIFIKIVLPNYREFRNNSYSERHAFNAAVSIAHMVDHINVADGSMNPGNLEKKLKSENASFEIVYDMCSAFKHGIAGHVDHHVRGRIDGMSFLEPTNRFILSGGSKLDDPKSLLSGYSIIDKTLMFEHGKMNEDSETVLTKHPVAWHLFIALRFIAEKIGCGGLLKPEDQPSDIGLVKEQPQPSGSA